MSSDAARRFLRHNIGIFDRQAFTAGAGLKKLMGLKILAKPVDTRQLTCTYPILRLNSLLQGTDEAMQPHQADPPSPSFSRFKPGRRQRLVLRVGVNARVDQTDILRGGLLNDCESNREDQAPERLRIEVEDRTHAVDAQVVMEQTVASEPRQFFSNSQLADGRRAIAGSISNRSAGS
jgi:hypothetical protein